MAGVTRTTSQTSTTSRDITKKGEFGYPSGHLGHLTVTQEQSLLEFKKLVKERDFFREAKDGRPPYPDDVTLLRFLRARRFVPKDALQQLVDTEKWRETNEIDNLYRNIDVHEYTETWKLYPQWIGRRDKRGLPVYVFEVAPLNSKRMAEYNKSTSSTTVLHSKRDHTSPSKDKDAIPSKLYRLFALYENLQNFAMPLCTALRDRPVSYTPISQANNIVDISKVGLKQFWNLRSHMQDASVLATAHYPETLDRIFIVGAPSFFPTVWEWVKRWFDPITVSKIFILSEAQAFKTLSTFIDPENIPEKYGGKLPYKFGGGPVLDPEVASRIEFCNTDEPWPSGPLTWERLEDGQEIGSPDLAANVLEGASVGTWKLMAVGSEGNKERRKHIATLKPEAIPQREENNEIPEEAPDRSIDFATQKVKFNPRASWAGSTHSRGSFTSAHSNPHSPTIDRQPSTSGSTHLSRSVTQDRIEEENGDAAKKGPSATKNAASDDQASLTEKEPVTEKEGNDARSNPPKLIPVEASAETDVLNEKTSNGGGSTPAIEPKTS